jgi:N utilization substance protein A
MKDFYELYNLENLEGLNDSMVSYLIEAGIEDIEKLSNATPNEITECLDVNEEEAVTLINKAIDYLSSKLEEAGIFEEGELEEMEEEPLDETEREEDNE